MSKPTDKKDKSKNMGKRMYILPSALRKYAGKIADFERSQEDGSYWLYYADGWKSGTDALGAQHQDHVDTITELVRCVRGSIKCDCPDCTERLAVVGLSVVVKNHAAVSLAKLRWAGATDKDKDVVRANGRLGGRPRTDATRCPCGSMTHKRAVARGHKCEVKIVQDISRGSIDLTKR